MNAGIRPTLERVNAVAAFNHWAGFVIEELEPGRCALALAWRPDLGQYAGLLHAGVAAALMETSSGFAAFTEIGPNLVSQLSISFVAPARGERFRAEARLIRAGRRQTFAEARLFALAGAETRLAATAATILVRAPRESEARAAPE